MGNPVVHFEIGVAAAPRASRFYGDLFGWEITVDEHGYGAIGTGGSGGIDGGIMQTPEGVPPYVTVYVQVADLPAFLERAERLGGKVLMEPMPIEGIGSFAMVRDPDGNPVGLFKQGEQRANDRPER